MTVISRLRLAVAVAGCSLFAVQSGAQVVTPSNPQGWAGYTYYGPTGNSPGSGASAAITSAYARSGNGSAQLSLADALNSEADWGITFNSSYGLGSLRALSYEWYRSSSSTANGIVAPAFALQLTDNNFLIYEYAYNHAGNPIEDTWVSEGVIGGKWWFTGNATGGVCDRYGAFETLSYFNSTCYGGSAMFNGITMFMGYAYAGTFDGAVDNVEMDIGGGPSYAWNFEPDAVRVVPEPTSVALIAAGLFGIAVIRRRKRVL